MTPWHTHVRYSNISLRKQIFWQNIRPFQSLLTCDIKMLHEGRPSFQIWKVGSESSSHYYFFCFARHTVLQLKKSDSRVYIGYSKITHWVLFLWTLKVNRQSLLCCLFFRARCYLNEMRSCGLPKVTKVSELS